MHDKIAMGVLMYFVMPLWLIAGLADYLCHRARRIEFSTGIKESLIHLLLFTEMGVPMLAALFLDDKQEFTVRPHRYIVMGDNTMNSLDSRAWGDFAQESVIGKSAFVYWPFLNQGNRPGRFGWSHR